MGSRVVLWLMMVSVGQCLVLPSPDLHWQVYQQLGDIHIGGIFPIHRYSPQTLCSENLLGTLQTQFVEAMTYAVNRINNRSDILPGIKLGYVITDDCTRDTVALARALSFIPRITGADTSSPKMDNGVNVTHNVTERHASIPHYKVVGVLGSMRSRNTILVAELLTLFQIPQISAVSTADELSDSEKYPYFLRMVLPDQNQAETIVALLNHFNWTYISTLYSQGSYGSGGINKVKDLARLHSICIAYSEEIRPSATEEDFDNTIVYLRKYSSARAVVIFANAQEAKGVLAAAKRANAHGEFNWITSDGLSSLSSLAGMEDVGLGAFMVKMHGVQVPSFDPYFKSLSPNTSTNPWFGKFWEKYFGCSWSSTIFSERCTGDEQLSASTGYSQDTRVALFIDAVDTFAYGFNKTIQEMCPDAFQNHDLLQNCLRGDNIIQYLKYVKFEGEVGKVQFDEKGDMLGKYVVNHVVRNSDGKYQLVPVALWERDSGLQIWEEKITWVVKNGENETDDTMPDSVCSKPCKTGEIAIEQDVPCCWVCHICRENEISNVSKCDACPQGYWPDLKRLDCEKIDLSFLSFPANYAVSVVVFAILGLLCLMAILIVFIWHRNKKLVKATSRELSFLILTGTLLSYLTVFWLVTKPTGVTCVWRRVWFHVSFTIAYAPLLVKTTRIYRIFEAGKKGNKRPLLIGNKFQMAVSLTLILVQIAITMVTSLIWPPSVLLRVPVVTERYAELICDMPPEGLVVPLSYNLLLIFCCIYFAFKTRHLPENFNESKYIFLCVCTTSFLFTAFLPTYFAAFYITHKSALLALCLILNASVMLLCLFLPKLYAIYMLGDSLNQMNTTNNLTTASSRVAPVST